MPDNSANRARYHQRLQRVISHINANLDDALDLDTLAEVACLSRFHWHRIYRGPNERLGRAYDWIFGDWLPASGEAPANQPALNIYYNSPQTTAPEDLRTDICIPLMERT